MKRIITWIFGIVFTSVFLHQHVTRQYSHDYSIGFAIMLGAIAAVTVCVAVIMIWAVCRLIRRASSSVVEKVKDKTSDIIDKTGSIISDKTIHTIDNAYYAEAEHEIDNETFDRGLWSKALVNAKGNETVRKAEYIKLRAKELQQQKLIEDKRKLVETKQQEDKQQSERERYYQQANREVLYGTVDKDLWEEANVNAGGNEYKRRDEYIKLRITQLFHQRQMDEVRKLRDKQIQQQDISTIEYPLEQQVRDVERNKKLFR